MIYIIGGVARSGKSTVARHFSAETNTPYFSLDFLTHAIAEGIPTFELDLDSDDQTVGRQLRPVVDSLLRMILKDSDRYLVEGAALSPAQVAALSRAYPNRVQSCFLGYADIATPDKLQQIRQFGGAPDDWLQSFDDHTVVELIEGWRAESRYFRLECARLGLRYFEISADLPSHIPAIMAYLKQPNG